MATCGNFKDLFWCGVWAELGIFYQKTNGMVLVMNTCPSLEESTICSNNLKYDLRLDIFHVNSWTKELTIVPDNFSDIFFCFHSCLQVSDTQCLLVGGHNRMVAKPDDTTSDVLVQILFSSYILTDIRLDSLGSDPLAKSSMIMTPKENVFIVCGGTQERWALVSKYIAPALAWHLGKKKGCLLGTHQTCM